VDKPVLGLLVGASALALVRGGAAPAAASPAGGETGFRPAQSFADLPETIPDAVRTLRAVDQEASPSLQPVQYFYYGSNSASSGTIRICSNGSPGLSTCAGPSGGALNPRK